MNEILVSPEMAGYLIEVLKAYDVDEEFIKKACALKEVPALHGEESTASSYGEANEEWGKSDSCSDEEAASMRKLIEFAPERVALSISEGDEETMEVVLVDLFDSAVTGEDEEGQMLIIRALAELFLSDNPVAPVVEAEETPVIEEEEKEAGEPEEEKEK